MLFSELTESLDSFQDSCNPSYDLPEDLASPDFQWGLLMDVLPGLADNSSLLWELLELDETGQGPPSASVGATHSEAQIPWTQRPASQP